MTLSLQLRDVSFALVDDFLDYLDHAWIVSEADDLTKLLNAATHPGDHVFVHQPRNSAGPTVDKVTDVKNCSATR